MMNFDDATIQLFQLQAATNTVYKQYVKLLGIDPAQVKQPSQIPFLPIEFFKTHRIILEKLSVEAEFTSSGTSNTTTSTHYVHQLSVYEQSFFNAFEYFYGSPENYAILGLLPSYLERSGSSLVYMVEKLIQRSNKEKSVFYLNQFAALLQTLQALEHNQQPYILVGVTYALLDLAQEASNLNLPPLKHAIIMETGGMKGRRKEMVKEEMHAVLKQSFGVSTIHSEYGMTELLSQAYSKGEGIFQSPPSMRVVIRDVNDPFELLPIGRTGALNVIDLSNKYSCSFIATQDLGRILNANADFEVLGRFDNSDMRGCNLMY